MTIALLNDTGRPRRAGRGSEGPSRSDCSWVTAQPASPSPRPWRASVGAPSPSGKSRATRRRPLRRMSQIRATPQSTSLRQCPVARRSRSLRLTAPWKVWVAWLSRLDSERRAASNPPSPALARASAAGGSPAFSAREVVKSVMGHEP